MRRLRWPLILLASVLPHLYGLFSPPLDYHYHRQVNTAAIARNYHRNGLDFFNPQIDWEGDYRGRAATEFPLYMWLTGLLWGLGGIGDVWGRILSVLFSALTAIYLYEFLKGELEEEAAFYGSLLFCFIPLEVYFGRTIQPEALALLASMAALYHWSRYLKEGAASQWITASFSAFIAISHKLPYLYILGPLAGLAWAQGGLKAFRRPSLWLAPAAALGATAFWYRFASRGVYVVPSHPGEFWQILEYGRLAYFVQFQFLSRFPELTATYGGTFLLLLGGKELIFKRKKLFFGVWLACLALYIVAGGGYTFHHEYTSLPFALVNAALMGHGLWQIKRKRAWAWLCLLALSVPVHSALRIKHWYRVGSPFLLNAGKTAREVSSPQDLFLCNERASSVYLYYLDRRGWSWDLRETGESEIGRVEDKIRKGAKFFATAKDGVFADRDGFYARWFYARFPVVHDGEGLLVFKLRD
ncbi:MAG: glycosyltransferase family 39 protein [Elusimicrobia bacterium]|nr:glycosyltransferase family 39 protein [Elusimicrobiota bacterium]